LGPFDEGLNVIHAPNGSGKSTIFEAFQRALLDSHKVTGRDVEMLRPWGRSLSPKVTVEFAHGGVEYRIAKKFLDDPAALLERKEDGRFKRLAEGISADDQTRALFTQNPPGRGLARQENWGLAQVLWAPQGNLVLSRLTGDLVADIRSMLSTQVAGPGSGPLETMIEERYLEFFSPKGKLKTGKEAPLLVRLRKQLGEGEEEHRKALDSYLAFEESTRRVEDLRARRAQARHAEDEINRAITKAEVRAREYRSLRTELSQREEKCKAAEAQHSEMKQRIDIIADTGKKLSEVRRAVGTLAEEHPLKVKEKQDREKDIARTKAALEDARKGYRSVEDVEQLVQTARKFIDCRKGLSDLRTLTTKIQQVETALAVRKKERSDTIVPDTKMMRAIRRQIKQRDEAQSRIDASLISVEIVPQNDGLLDVVAGEKIGPRTLHSGAPTLIQGSPEVVADFPDVARLRAWGPTGSIEEHREAKTKAEKKLSGLTEPFESTDIDVLEALVERGRALDDAVTESETQLATLLEDRTLDELLQEQRVQEAILARILEQHPDWEQSPPDAAALESNAREAKSGLISAVASAESAWEVAQAAFTAAAGQEETSRSRLEEAHKQCESLESQYADLTKDEKQPDERRGEMQRLAMAWEAAKGRLKELEDRLAEFEDDPTAELEGLEAQREAAENLATDAREQEIREESKLEGLAAQGTYSALAEAEERVAQLRHDVAAEQLRVDAVRMLRDTVAACRAEAVASLTGPVEAAATRTFQRIASPRLGRIQIGENFEPSAIVPDTIAEGVSLENLSGGEQEQLYLATRLALAQALRRDERQLVVLDDVLTASDSGRLARVMNVLEEAAQDLQILILTCHPERYRALKSGKFFNLEEAQHR
jgi:DNA repair exonuclease SbcCD ATPase subunit